jgi:hypothetical protein
MMIARLRRYGCPQGTDRTWRRRSGDWRGIGGAHLSVTTLTRLRDRHDLTPFVAANLIAGAYDLRMSPSARNWGR